MRKHYLSLCLVAGLLLGSATGQAGSNLWTNIAPQSIPSTLKQNVFPTTYQAFRLDLAEIKATLQSAGNSYNTGVRIRLPMGDHTQELVVWKDNVMAPELQEKYPDILSFIAVDPANHAISGRLDLNMYGFYGMIVNPEYGSYMIDPFSLQSTDYYVGYWRKDLDGEVYNTGICSTKDPLQQGLLEASETVSMPNLDTRTESPGLLRSHGNVKRIYRCAISCTGEWAYFITGGAPSVPGVLSIIASLISRCNVVFQRELSMKLELIPTNNEIIYIDPGSDPYTCTGESHDCLIGQVQDNLDEEYPGGVGYDIGHIFCTNPGGLAQLQAVCGNGKGSGVSGVMGTEDIGTIIHEMGHQLGAPHTFNSNQGGCSGNASGPTAYEPGSGTSIMSYNGSCLDDNLTPPTTEYYHVSSLEKITDYIVYGFGASCGETEIGTTPVTILSLGDTFIIPKNTPFELISEEPVTSEPAPPVVSYSWEQFDLGHFEELEAEAGGWDGGPSFESRAPAAYNKSRQFPDNSIVIADDYTAIGQRLPLEPRLLNFKLTHRTYFEGWGTFNYSDDMVTLSVDTFSNKFRVNKPNTTALYEVGAPIEIDWDTVNTRRPPFNIGFVNIYMSINGGNTFPFLVAANVPNTGEYFLSAPNVYSDNIYFKVKASGNVFYDINKEPVKIHGEHVGIDDNDLLSGIRIYPNPADGLLNIKSDQFSFDPLMLSMYDIAGRQVYKEQFTHSLQIDVSNMTKGTYLLNIVHSKTGKTKTEKIVVK